MSSLDISISILNLLLQSLVLFDLLPENEVDQLGELPHWDEASSLWVEFGPELIEFVQGILRNLKSLLVLGRVETFEDDRDEKVQEDEGYYHHEANEEWVCFTWASTSLNSISLNFFISLFLAIEGN